MLRCFILLAAYGVFAQTVAAKSPEQALRARVQQFFQLQVEKKYRQAEALVAKESKDDYYNNGKYNIKSCAIEKVELTERNSRAKVTIKAKVTLMMPEAGPMEVEAPISSYWKTENGQWFLYIDPSPSIQTPFGTLKRDSGHDAAGGPATPFHPPIADAATLQKPVSVDRTEVVFTGTQQSSTLIFTNSLPGGVDLEITSDPDLDLSWDLEKPHVDASAKTSIQLRVRRPGHRSGVLHILVSPIGARIDVRVTVD